MLPRTWAEKIQQVSIRGTPDILGCMNGNFFAIELKRSPKAKIDPLQLHKLNAIDRAGGGAWIVNPENWSATLEEMIETYLADVEINPETLTH